jgi:N-acetylglucosamine-6-phosphate deacetylase
MAHTAADYKTAAAAIGEGATHLTHLYNAMPPFWHREPGVIGAAFEDGRVTAEVICDGVHVHESAVRAAFRLFGEGRVILVSDAVSPCGAGEGTYRLGVGTVEKKGRKALLEDGTLAGSVTHLFDCMKRAVSFQIPVEKAVRAAAYNPAALLGLAGEAGSVSVGKRADLILCDKALGIEKVYIEGEPVWRTK